jgi:hypothetical protein
MILHIDYMRANDLSSFVYALREIANNIETSPSEMNVSMGIPCPSGDYIDTGFDIYK